MPRYSGRTVEELIEYIDRPLVTTENIHYLDEVWKEYDKETHEWGNWGLDGFEAAMNK